MADSFKQFALSTISGQNRGFAATSLRVATRAIEPFYATAMMLRNACYDRGIFQSHPLHRPTISVGNITTGGTGKTPVVRWLANQMLSLGHHPAILLRGYGSSPDSTSKKNSDEAQLLSSALNIPVQPNPSRIDGARVVLQKNPNVDLFILDDAFQHRRARRDFNLVVISATNPFGYNHVLPRGLLREPLRGLARADAFLITRQSLVTPGQLEETSQFLRQHHRDTPVYHCDHHHSGVHLPLTNQTLTIADLSSEKVFLLAGIGDPASFTRQIEHAGIKIIGNRWFDDHHAFTSADVSTIPASALPASALVLTTEKDWVKLKPIWPPGRPIGIVKLALRFANGDEESLLSQITTTTFPEK
jgi:tetraacyldisaccharide 4'-kinase